MLTVNRLVNSGGLEYNKPVCRGDIPVPNAASPYEKFEFEVRPYIVLTLTQRQVL